MHFNGFPKKGLTFLNKIIVNNSKEWLDVNREEYERVIVTPNKAYIEEMGEHLQALVPTIHAIPKTNKSLFRIYRDARFHLADPIKTCIGVIFWQGSGHRMQSSSFYMHYDPQEIFVATGIRNFKPTLLSTYREYIQSEERRTELHNILEALKARYNAGENPDLYFFRDQRGFEIDLIKSEHRKITPIEIKSAMTFSPKFINNLKKFTSLNEKISNGILIYSGNQYESYEQVKITNFKNIESAIMG